MNRHPYPTRPGTFTPWMWPWAAAIAITTLVCVAMPTVDHIDEQAFAQGLSEDQASALRHLQAQRRQQQHHVTVCHRAFGPQTVPAEDLDGNLVCVDRKGRAALPLVVAHATGGSKP